MPVRTFRERGTPCVSSSLRISQTAYDKICEYAHDKRYGFALAVEMLALKGLEQVERSEESAGKNDDKNDTKN